MRQLMKMFPAFALATMLGPIPIHAEDLPQSYGYLAGITDDDPCYPAYLAAMLGTITNHCKNLRVTEAGSRLSELLKQSKLPKDCEDRAKREIGGEMLEISRVADANDGQTKQLWCGNAQKILEMNFPKYKLVEIPAPAEAVPIPVAPGSAKEANREAQP